MAEIGAVYDATPAPRTPADILTSAAPDGYQPAPVLVGPEPRPRKQRERARRARHGVRALLGIESGGEAGVGLPRTRTTAEQARRAVPVRRRGVRQESGPDPSPSAGSASTSGISGPVLRARLMARAATRRWTVQAGASPFCIEKVIRTPVPRSPVPECGSRSPRRARPSTAARARSACSNRSGWGLMPAPASRTTMWTFAVGRQLDLLRRRHCRGRRAPRRSCMPSLSAIFMFGEGRRVEAERDASPRAPGARRRCSPGGPAGLQVHGRGGGHDDDDGPGLLPSAARHRGLR